MAENGWLPIMNVRDWTKHSAKNWLERLAYVPHPAAMIRMLKFVFKHAYLFVNSDLHMCFSIPKKIKQVLKDEAITETGSRIRLGDIKVSPGDYLLVYGNMAVEKIGKKKAEDLRKTLAVIT